jgi:hypothetical protein
MDAGIRDVVFMIAKLSTRISPPVRYALATMLCADPCIHSTHDQLPDNFNTWCAVLSDETTFTRKARSSRFADIDVLAATGSNAWAILPG